MCELIVIDSREKDKEYFYRQLLGEGVQVYIDKLDMGDFFVFGDAASFLVERKTIKDFCNSIVDRRLFNQASALADAAKRGIFPLVVVEGSVALASKVSNLSRAVVHGAIYTLYHDFGIPVLFFSSRYDTVLHLSYLDGKAGELKRPKPVLPVRKPKFRSEDENKIAVIAMLPHIGYGIAYRLLKKYGSVKAVINLPKREFMRMSWVTPRHADDIYRIINEPFKGEDIPMPTKGRKRKRR